TVDSLRLTASGAVALNEANGISTVAGSAGNTTLNSVLPLTVGAVLGHTGLSVDNLTLTAPSITFSQASNIDSNLTLTTNDLTVAAAVTAGAQISVQRTTAGDIDLGSKPGGGVLGLDAADIANFSVPSLLIGGTNVTTMTVSAPVAADVGHLTVKAGQFDVAGGGSLSNTGHLSVLADDADLAGTLSSTGGDVLLAPRAAGHAVEVGTSGSCTSTLCLDAAELSTISTGGTGWLKLGNDLSGSLTVVSGTSIGGARLALAGSGILIDSGADISLSDALSLKADDLTIDPTAALAATNTIEILRRSAGDMDLGTKPGGGILGLTTGELNRLFTDKLVVGDLNTVNLTISQLLTTGAGEAFENVTGNLALAGRNQVFNASVLPAADLLLVGSQGITVNGLETIGSGAASSTLTIRHFNSASGDIELGSFCGGGALCVDTATLAKLTPGASTTLRVEGGTLHINDDIAPSATNVVLQAGDASNYGVIASDATITATNLAAVGANGVSLTFANNVTGSFAASSLYGDIAFTNAAGSVTIGTVAGVSGVRANTTYGGGNLSLTVDDLNVTQPIQALGGTVQIDRYTPGNADLGGGTGPGLKLASAEMNLISADTLRLGMAATLGTVDVTGPLNSGLALANIGNLSVRGNSFNVPNAIATTGFLEFIGNIGTADMTLTQQLNGNTVYLAVANLAISGLGGIAGTSSVNIAASAGVDLGGADVAGTTLGLTPAELSTISSPTFGISAGSGSFNVTAPLAYGAGNLAFQSHGPLNINQPVSVTAGELQMMSDSMNINAAVSASGRVWISHITGSTDVDLGTKTGGKLGLTAAELNRITTTDLEFQGNDVAVTALLDKSAGGALEHVGNLAIGSESINVAAGGIDAGTGNIRFSANSMNVAAPVTATGNVLLSVQSGGRSVTLGSEVAGQLSLTDAELDQFSTPSLSIQGYGIQIAAPLSFAAGSLPLVALKALSTGINQSAGATVSASNLALTAISGVSMGETNAVDTLAGSTTGYNASFSFNNGATPLTIGSVATETGIQQTYYYGSLTLTANDLTIAQPVVSNTYGSIVINADTLAIGASVTSSGANTTIRPLTAGREIDFGTETAGKLSLTSAELGFVSANNFYLGSTATGNVTVSAATTAPGTVQVTSGGILAVNAPFTATNLTLVADNMDIGALVTASGKTVTPMTAGREIDLGSETAGKLSLTAAEIANFNAGGNLVIGNSGSGNITVTAPIAWAGPNLRFMTAQGVVDGSASGIDITTPYLEIYRGTGVGAGNPLETALSNLYVDAGAGDVLVNNTSGSLGVQVGTTTGSIAISNTGSLNTSSSMAASGGSITLTGSSVNQGGNLSADIAVDVTATAGAINMGTRSTTAPGIHYRATGNITVGVLTGTAVTVESGADISDANGDWTRDVVADSATLIAAGNLDIDVRAPAQSISVGGTSTVRDMSCSTAPLPVEAPPMDICILAPTLCAAPPPPSVGPAVSLAPPAEEDKKRRLKQCR
ncbi:MAG: hypothetical protein JNM82_06505, partial [Rhodocyclaceae bacterium]|nr:hypothetical protein [Rhodocyclaceae bacterium]